MSAGQILLDRILEDGRTARVVVTDRADGDLRVTRDTDELEPLRRAITPHRWTWLRQVHGADVVTVSSPGAEAGSRADAAVTAATDAALAVHTADCAPVALVDGAGAVGVAHVGWRGLVAGVLPATVAGLRAMGGGPVEAVLGPCIGPGCYEFGEDALEVVVAAVGPPARGVTRSGRPALDLPAAVTAELARVGVDTVTVDGRCTSCREDRFSHRARGDQGRQALVAWIEP